jgi:ribosome modulation factor
VGTKRSRPKNETGEDTVLANIHGYIAAQSRRVRDSCPHGDGPLRAAWLEGYEAGIKAMTDWGANVFNAAENPDP